ncbi:MAG: Peptide chain release factor 3 [Elusimicrobia bacterium]|nr:Peptide chain release factor 3 [Elusimicrobiota bacterium]
MKNEIARRRTFAIISHPDAGKTTLTEKFLLYGGAVQLAGSVTARKNQRESTSDWMELERKRGISVSSTVLQFDYNGFRVNLLDTPGHRDFSEDTYRVLTAVDAVVMVIDAAKGIEAQTRKLFEVCRQRHVPIFTFMNKCDRPMREPLALLDELESVLKIHAFPMSWPLGDGPYFRGVYERQKKEVHLFERVVGGMYRAPVQVHDLSDAAVREKLDDLTYGKVTEELEMLEAAGTVFDGAAVLRGEVTPVFFGSASNNFGVQMLLDGFLALSTPPVARKSTLGEVPLDGPFSGFIFKIQGNMDPRHRDRIAFMRICSGKFTRDMLVFHSRSGKKMKLSNSHKLFGRDREIVEEAYPGDIVGLVGYDEFGVGDTLTEDPTIVYNEIPRFPSECFAFIHNPSPAKFKPFRKGLDQLLTEGIVQMLYLKNSPKQAPLLAAVGQLQFEVVQYRLESEYGAESRLERTNYQLFRWIDAKTDPKVLSEMRLPPGAALVEDMAGQTGILFDAEWALKYFRENNPGVVLHDTADLTQLITK